VVLEVLGIMRGVEASGVVPIVLGAMALLPGRCCHRFCHKSTCYSIYCQCAVYDGYTLTF